jgi:glycosyltransferase involved in cell wall biosynthesis
MSSALAAHPLSIAFLSTRREKASFRFRVERILPYFDRRGHRCDVRFLPATSLQRVWSYRRLTRYDVVFVQKRLFSAAELFVLRRCAGRLVYDLDDAVMFDGEGRADSRRERRFRAMARAADAVVCGNEYLAGLARAETPAVTVVPTCVDAKAYHPRLRPAKSDCGPLVVGWTGSGSTNRYLGDLFPVLAEFRGRVELKILSDTKAGFDFDKLNGLPVTFVPWSPAVEVTETATFDVGLMPLPDNPWTRGKCGFKALQYMGLGIPAVCSPVGVNCEILTHGANGLLAATPNQWRAALTQLLRDAALRTRLGQAGRQTIENHYALHVQAPRLVAVVENMDQTASTSRAA